ncbi:hypothetical protein PFICI_05246 [Pestalotiopsis fici W106-1]|uniref:DUF7730 domain-containing protein n=1 Tax=Pestalotiopsis fici (strain W106-1 / CGMCC3.15140) TaxID=1229662 RepID=W3XBF2_PESFW|nr:uncharacterized protein PFICI_05246 [Pestalotiopsis fici W106-1]ETS83370.1 hypothetical protein PFICI_05246 [Pestalotiopsis fici W106-1]
MTEFTTSRECADTQSQSSFFGLLPREVRDMIYAHLWEASKSRQHVFQREGGSLTHYACTRPRDSSDERNEKFEKFWHRYRDQNPGSTVRDAIWAQRISSTWNEHWCCEEAMLKAEAGVKESKKSTRSIFLSCLLACKQMHHEAGPSLYSHITFILTTLPASHRFFVTNPSPHLKHARSLELSLNVPYAALHNYNENNNRQQHAATLRPNAWADVCIALSNLCLEDSNSSGDGSTGVNVTLRSVALRLDLVEDDRFWWEVRESSALSPIHGPLRARLALQLPELTVDVDRMRMFQYESSISSNPTTPSESASGNWGEAEDDQGRGNVGSDNQPFLVYPLPSYLRSCSGSNVKKRLISDFQSLKRYSRRRWTTTDSLDDGIEARLEFFSPREHAPEALVHRMTGLFRGMLMG